MTEARPDVPIPGHVSGHQQGEAAITRRAAAEPGLSGDDGAGPRGLFRPTSTQQVADYIRRQVFEGKLRADSRVPQDEMAAELGVSRVPVREAVIALDREGWVMQAGDGETAERELVLLLGREADLVIKLLERTQESTTQEIPQ